MKWAWALCVLWLPSSALAQVSDTVWDDPDLRLAVFDADAIVRAVVREVGADGALYEVDKTLKGEVSAEVHVAGLHHPKLDAAPPVKPGDEAYLLLIGGPDAEVYLVPTPSFGRFPVRAFGERELVVVPLHDTFVRLPVEPAWFERYLQACLGGGHAELVADARASLAADDLDTTTAYVALSVLAQFGDADDADRVLSLLDDPQFKRDEAWKVRGLAALALGRVATQAAAMRLVGLIERDAIGAVRSQAATALGTVCVRAAGEDWIEPLTRRLAAVASAELTPQRLLDGSAEPIRFARLDDPRRNTLPPLAAAALSSLGRAGSRAGIEPALNAIARHEKPNGVGLGTHRVLLAGLAYLEALNDPRLVGEIAARLRASDADDARVSNPLIVQTLENVTGASPGDTREAWLGWWRQRHPQQGPPPGAPR